MRRPSRQGLIPVCTSGDRKLSATPHFKSPEQGFCFTDDLSRRKRQDNYGSFFYFLKATRSFTVMVMFFSASCHADAQDLKDKAKNFFDAVRLGGHPAIPMEFSQNAAQALEGLQPFLIDSNERVALTAYEIVSYVSSRSAAPVVRAAGITTLMAACHNIRPSIRSSALELLKQFRKDEFPSAAKDSLRKFVQDESAPPEALMQMAGFLHLSDLIPQIRPWSQPGNPAPRRWAALLTLARMGDSFAITDIMQRVKRLPVNDDLIYRIFPDLVYTRQPEAIAYMVEVLSNDQHACSSADLERETPIPCGYRIMEQLAPIIEGFPIQLDDGGDLETDHYPDALEQSRQWFMLNKTYTVLNDRY